MKRKGVWNPRWDRCSAADRFSCLRDLHSPDRPKPYSSTRNLHFCKELSKLFSAGCAETVAHRKFAQIVESKSRFARISSSDKDTETTVLWWPGNSLRLFLCLSLFYALTIWFFFLWFQYFLKNLLTAVLCGRKGFKVRENRFIYSIGTPMPNPILRNYPDLTKDL